MNRSSPPAHDFEFLAIGEALIDLISVDISNSLAETRAFERSSKGQPANLTRNMTLLGNRTAYEQGERITLDPNFHPCIWPDTSNFLDVLEDAYQYVRITKPSIDDCNRISGAGLPPSEYANRFLDWGAKIIAITMGADGVYLATEDHKPDHIFANQIPVADVTGAGDAFWSGFLTALTWHSYIRGSSLWADNRRDQNQDSRPIVRYPRHEKLNPTFPTNQIPIYDRFD
jgi:sugar/nucleoside kinase (ribokinase family)